MHTQTFHRSAIRLGALLATLFCSLALADDTEIFFNNLNNGANANIMFILDSSGSMTDVVTTQLPYDSTVTYAATACGGSSSNFSSTKVYYGTGGNVPGCGSSQSITLTNFKCVDATNALATGAGTASPGFYNGNMIQWGSFTTKSHGNTSTVFEWQGTLGLTNGTSVECQNDAGVAGNGSKSGNNLYPSKLSNASSTTGVWDVKANSWWSVSGNVGTAYVIYSANYLNYYHNSGTTTSATKVQILQQGIKSILDSVSNVNVGLMRYDAAGAGGMVMEPIRPIATNEAPILATVNSDAPFGTTPISETLYESYLYFSGGAVHYGNTSTNSVCTTWQTIGGLYQCTNGFGVAYPSVASSRTSGTITGANYARPASTSCQKNYVVFLTDGLPNNDGGAAADKALITGLPSFSTVGGACYTSGTAMYTALGQTGGVPAGTDGTGLCTAALAKYMHGTDLDPTVSGLQNVTSYFIGFGNDFKDTSGAPTAAFAYLQDAAVKGGGQAYTATSLSDLTAAFNQILSTVVTTNTMFSAPAVAVNAFNRTQTLNDLYVSVFSPQSTYHWPGNVKKYKVVNNVVVDANGTPAVDPGTGFFLSTAQSYWSPGVDGSDVTLGGVAANLPNYATRKVYTYIGANPAGTGVALSTAAASAFTTSNTALTATNLSIGGSTDPSLTNLINWVRGQDVQDENVDGSTTDMRHDMGDPIHTAPALVIYGKNTDLSLNIAAFVPTNDGYLHAMDATTGVELWTFIPQEMFPHLVDLFNNPATTTKHYGIDGAITVLSYDINGDGTIDAAAGDRVILYFGTGRNTDTSTYYAMDVTDKNAPKLLWAINGNQLPGIGQAWSQPQITRVNISGATQNSQKLVLVIGGGYDPAEDGYTYVPADGVGNHIFMVDALKGTLLWDAGNTSSYNFNNARMDHSIPAGVAVIDFDGDGYADRMYVGDMAGQLWRFDITNGQPVNSLVTGGVIASLGTKEDTAPVQNRTRRFYNMPDVASVNQPGVTGYLNIAIGSGYRGHPLDQPPPPTSGPPSSYQPAHDRFYSIRDISTPFGTLTQSDFNDTTKVPLIRDAQILTGTSSLVDVTTTVTPTIPPGSRGWQLDLSHDSEKVLSSSTTFNNSIIFTTYTPSSAVVTDPCAGVGAGTNRVYQVNVFNASPSQPPNSGSPVTTADRGKDLAQSGIAPQVTMLFLPPPSGPGSPPASAGTSDIVLMSGAETVGVLTLNARQKTYWRDGTAN
jgi:type IV pilus assembly protein PilY1